MKKFTVFIEEHILFPIEVEADDAERAMTIAIQAYNHSDPAVVKSSGVTTKLISIGSPDDEATEWVEF